LEKLKAIHVVYAEWCPHCVPTTVGPLKAAAARLGVDCVLYDIDTDKVKAADDIVKKYGDWSDDYLVPQVFLEYAGGEVKHVLTGNPQGVGYTRSAVEELLGRLQARYEPDSLRTAAPDASSMRA
jgi:glutaredoxin